MPRWEAWAAPVYFALHLAYLFRHRESEILHWVTLVALPLALVWLGRRSGSRPPVPLAATFGLRRGNLSRGLGLAVLLGLGVTVFQLFGSRFGPQILDEFRSGRALWLLPLAFLLMALTAGFTEEFFFRGFLQTRLETLFRSRVAAWLTTSLLFGVYHLPYAYLNPRWPSAGDWGAAWSAALGQGVPGGLLLGGLYLLTGRNLLACVVLHSLINAAPAMTLVRFSGG